MGSVYTSVEELVGNTPLVELGRLANFLGLSARILCKVEWVNPAGSIKDRTALFMIEDAEKRGLLAPGGTIIEPTSGNTGIGLAAIGGARGYKVIIVMPGNMSEERQKLMRAYGAQVVLSPGSEGMTGAIRLAEKLRDENPGSVIMDQFGNKSNAKAHYDTTGPEIYRDTEGNVDIFLCGVGTGGTITGAGKYLKEKKPGIKIIGVEPETSAVLSGKPAGSHGLQGLGAGFVPQVLDTGVYDEIIPVSDGDAMEYMSLLAKKEGLFAGISSGAALSAAVKVAKREENKGKTIVVILPDTGDRYLSVL